LKVINIGICGLGTVGYGSYSVLKSNSRDIARRVGAEVKVTHIGARRLRPGQDIGSIKKVLMCSQSSMTLGFTSCWN